MRLVRKLADRILHDHPERGALVLERHAPECGIEVLSRVPLAAAAGVLRRRSPSLATQLISSLPM